MTTHSRVTGLQLRRAMAKVPTGVAVVTSLEEGRPVGMTVSAFTSVSDDPPTVLVCLNQRSRVAGAVRQSGVLAVNILSGSQAIIARTFATPGLDHAQRFEEFNVSTALSGAPVLDDALCWLDCEVLKIDPVATHLVTFGAVVAAGSSPTAEAPLSYYNRSMGPLA